LQTDVAGVVLKLVVDDGGIKMSMTLF